MIIPPSIHNLLAVVWDRYTPNLIQDCIKRILGGGRVPFKYIGNTEILHVVSKKTHIQTGKYVRIGKNTICSGKIYIDDYSYIQRNSNICAGSQIGLSIGKYVAISWNVSIIDHSLPDTLLTHGPLGRDQKTDKGMVIGHDVWIGSGAFIAYGVNIGTGAVIGANAVITKDVPPYAVMGGVNKLIKFRFAPNVIENLLRSEWRERPLEKIQKNLFEKVDFIG